MTNPGKTSRREGGLRQELGRWIRAEQENRELEARVAAALEETRSFCDGQRAELAKRKGRLLQSAAFRDETLAMENAVASIQQLLAEGRNISRIFSEIDKYVAAHRIADTLSRQHTRNELADARDVFMCAHHDSIRGSRLARLLDVLHFMPFAYWRSRGPATRNYRAPAAGEILALLAEFERLGVDADAMDTVQLAVLVRLQLGITPRMGYHVLAASNRLAERLTSGENLTRFIAKAMPLGPTLCQGAGRTLEALRRWSGELFGDLGPAPPEIEAQMLQIALLAEDQIRIGTVDKARSTDYLWLLCTVVAGGHALLKDSLAWPSIRESAQRSVLERVSTAKAYLDQAAVLADGIIAERWTQAREELKALVGRSESLAAKGTLAMNDFRELEKLRDRRSGIGKALIKLSECLRLVEPTLLDALSAADGAGGGAPGAARLRGLVPGAILDRNRARTDETRLLARREFESLRALVARMGEISRKGLAAAATSEAPEQPRPAARTARATSDGVELATLPTAALEEKLLDVVRRAPASIRDARTRFEAVRKRLLKSGLLHAMNAVGEKMRKAAVAGEELEAGGLGAAQAATAAETAASLHRELLAALTGLGARMAGAKLAPAEKQALTTALAAIKTKLGEEQKDVEALCAELAERAAAGSAPGPTAARAATGDAVTALDAAGLVAAANAALRPVKDAMVGLGKPMAERDHGAVLAAAGAVTTRVAEARDALNARRALLEAAAPDGGPAVSVPLEKVARWLRQLDAVDAEAGRVLTTAACVVETRESARTAGALGEALSDQALVTLARSFERLAQAREVCAAAAQGEWRVLKGAAAYLAGGASDLDACQAVLQQVRSRIEAVGSARRP